MGIKKTFRAAVWIGIGAFLTAGPGNGCAGDPVRAPAAIKVNAADFERRRTFTAMLLPRSN